MPNIRAGDGKWLAVAYDEIYQLKQYDMPWFSVPGPALEPRAPLYIQDWWQRAQGAYPPNTRKAWGCDWASFTSFCELSGYCPLPASPETVAAFVQFCRESAKKPATVKRYLSTIALAHRVAKLLNPRDDEAVRLEMKAFTSAVGVRQRQARALGWAEIKKFLETAGESLPATRERALISLRTAGLRDGLSGRPLQPVAQ